MPTADQLAHIAVVDGDGSSVVPNDDGSVQTSWPDGTVRTDEADGRIQVVFPDFSVLNIETDGTRTLNDASGRPLDLVTGQALDGSGSGSLPTPDPTSIEELQEVVEGISSIADLAKAEGLLRALNVAAVVDKQYSALAELAGALEEALKGELSPVAWFMQPVKMLLAVIKATETEERGAKMRSWCYTLVYDALGMGDPPQPTFRTIKGEDQAATDEEWWNEGHQSARAQLDDGQTGVALRNRVLLLIAKCGGDPAKAVTELWAAACQKSGDDEGAGLLKTYDNLSWPQPTGV